MARVPDEEPDLKLSEDLVFGGKGLVLERFDRAETLAGRTPDFRVRKETKLAAFCEVKSPRDDWLDEQLDSAEAFEIVGGVRSDPTFNRIAQHVQKAATQFEAVNPNHDVPNILVFVNHDEKSGYGDLRETVTGLFHAQSGERFPTMQHISEGRLGDARLKVDLYLWIDAKTRRIQGYVFNETHEAHVDGALNPAWIG
jgi:hypothetical protein